MLTGLAAGCGGVLAAEQKQARRDERGVGAEPVDLVEDGRGAVAERACLAFPAGKLDRSGDEHRLRPGSGLVAAGTVVSTARERSGLLPFRRL